MARIKEISNLYDIKLAKLHNPQEWEVTLKRTSNFWRLSFCEAMLLTEQNPRAQMCGTLAQWNKVGRFVKRGEHSMAVFKNRTDTQLMYLFDVSQTYGKAFSAKWKMSEGMADGIVGKFNAENDENAVSLEDFLQKSLDKKIDIVYNYNSKLNTAMENDPGIPRFIRESAECICMTRCGIDKSYDFSEAAHFSDDVSIIEIGNAANLLAQEVLREIDRTVRRREYELYQAGVCGRHLRYPLRGGRERAEKSDLPELRQSTNDTAGAESRRPDERTRPDSSRPSEYERTLPDNLEGNWTESGANPDADRRKSAESKSFEPDLHRAGETEGRNIVGGELGGLGVNPHERDMALAGGSQTSEAESYRENSAEYSELTNYSDEDSNSEDEEIYDETVSEKADTVSYFSDKPVDLDSNTDFAQKLLDEEITHGSGFSNGKFRIEDYVRNENPSVDELARFLKNEYGIGGSSRDGNPVWFSNHDAKGLSLELKEETGERQRIKYSWSKVAAAIKNAVSENRYVSQKDLESRARLAVINANRFSIHYEFPNCYENGHIEYIRRELKACGIELDTRITARNWAVYASEAIRIAPDIKKKYRDIDRSGIAADVHYGDYLEAENVAKTLIDDGYKFFVEACRIAASDLISDILSKTEGVPSLGYPDDEIAEFFAGDEALSDETVNEIAAKAFGYLYFDEQRNASWEKSKSAERSKTEQAAVHDDSDEDLQFSLFGNDTDTKAPEQSEKTEDVETSEEKRSALQLTDSVFSLENTEKENEVRHNVAPPVGNYHFPEDFSYPNGAKARYNANVTAIKTLKKIEAEHRHATAEEQDILAHYSGWGGTADAFDSTKENWSKEYAELRELLTDKEYKAARESTLTAFYTEPYIINSIYKALENFGFEGGYVLDPSAGTGNFLGCMPRKMAENSRLFGVELDSLTARIAKQLYPDAEIQNKGYEHTKFQNGTFDVIVGNVPFGDFSPYDPEYEDYLIHDYFFIKSLDKLKSGGIMAMITSSGTMDKVSSAMREQLFSKADFVGGIRLPEDAFRSAGTKTVTDILFFKKLDRERNISQYLDEKPEPDWLRADYKYNSETATRIVTNKYFLDNPEMVLGTIETTSGRYGAVTTVKSDGNTAEQLIEAVSRLECKFEAEPTIEELPEDEEYGDIPEGIQPYTYYVHENRLYYAENRSAVPFSGKNEERIKAMCSVLERLDELTNAQKRNCTDSELKMLQSRLNNAYDGFVKQYGNLNSRTNTSAFSDDVRAPRISSIENVEEAPDGTTTYSKADIFTQRTINTAHIPTHVDTALEALHLSMNTHQAVNIEYISQLCGRDKDEVISELGDRIYCNPAKNTGGRYTGWETAEEYLSGHVRSKLALAQEVAKENPDFERNVNALLDNQPPKIEITDIGFRLGTIYIPVEMVRSFIYETFETPAWQRENPNGAHYSREIAVRYIDELNQWKITNCGGQLGVLVNETYGTRRLNAYELTEMILNQKRAVVNDYRENSEGKVEKIFNARETILARECQDKIEQAFQDWVMADRSRIETVENIFNERYNGIKPRTYDGEYITVPGMNPNLTLRPHQKNVIARIAATGTCMMAHEVGAGKTAAMGAAGMYLKSIGACTKPMYVVPNAVVAQFAEELQRFFPEAKILAATSKDMEKSQRRRFLSKIAVGNYDAIIIPQSQFEKMPLSLERQEAMYSEKLSEISLAIQLAKADKGERFTVKALERQRKSLEKKIEKLRADFKKDDFITFEELGCDFLFVDEAHNYKNLAVFTKMNNVAGVNANANSQKAFDMEMKCRYLQEIHNGGGVVFATGTPISNSITELFVWQYLLQKQTLDDMQIGYFDNWASVFGVISQSIEVKPSGDGFRMRTRFSDFVNLNELCNLFGEVFDIAKTADMNLKLPQIKGGKPEMIICEKSPEQEEQTEIGIERARKIEEKLVKPEEDNMLAVCTYMTKVALDARIIDESAKEFEGGKVALCADKIIELNRENPGNAQAVFCDTNTPKKNSFSVYQALKDRLVISGEFTEKEIAFVHDAANDKQRLSLFEQVNKGEVKVIIGSTGKLGTGVNIQQKLSALHHLDAPYRPSDIEQRNGRGIRQGNTNAEVFVGYYSTKGTFDNYRWQILEKKQQIISQVLSGKPAARTCEDIDEVALTFAEMKAATTGNPLISEKMTVDNEVNRLKLLQSNHYQQQRSFEYDINTRYPKLIAQKEHLISLVKQDIAAIESTPAKGEDEFEITLDGKDYTERTKAGDKLEKLISKYQLSDESRDMKEMELGSYRGFRILAIRKGLEIQLELAKAGKYTCDYSFSGSGGITRICNLYERIPKLLDGLQTETEQEQRQLENAKAQYGKPFPHEQALKDLLERQSQINAELEFGKPEEVVLDESNTGDGEDEDSEEMIM